MSDDRAPILVGAGQLTQRDVEPDRALEPVAMMAATARLAAEDAGAGDRLLAAVDSLAVVNVFSFPYGNAPRLLAERLGIRPREELYTTIGGNTPQWLVNGAAARIAAGKAGVVLLAGAETVRSVVRARRQHVRLAWGGGDGTPAVVGEDRDGTSPYETAHGLVIPTVIYPLFENAIRARRGWSLEEHARRLGALCSRFAAVAAENPHAWFRERRTPEEIATVTADNRMIGYPYPKLMNAILDVDQAAAVIMTSAGRARALGIHPSRWVYLWGAADAHDHWFVSERVDYASSPAIRAVGEAALAQAGTDVGAIDHFDLYSCFPSAVQIGRDMLGIPEDDPRPLTVTGGLAYFGGPGNNYSMHAIATMMDRLRAAPGTKGLVTALGWYLTKHALGIYGTAPPPRPFAPTDGAAVQRAVDAEPAPALVEAASGRATIETYTVLHDRDGAPVRGIVVGRTEDGRRFLANTPGDRTVLDALVAREAIGGPGTVRRDGDTNVFDPA
ncbi:MAG TPA: acetyl-CoA acetyltransferase [Candidatus Eisenbacteria bacterium]|nr:acetyl-CoA acetyltransferase [Candidatus Eisenbacteria bacterium]